MNRVRRIRNGSVTPVNQSYRSTPLTFPAKLTQRPLLHRLPSKNVNQEATAEERVK